MGSGEKRKKERNMARNKKLKICSKCHKERAMDELFSIDGKLICVCCIYAETEPFVIYPIGVVKNKLKLNGTNFGSTGQGGLSCIELLDSQKPFLYKIEEEQHITVVYYLHKSSKVKSVFNRGLDGKKVGVFASRTPHRLSKIAIQDVRLVEVDGVRIYVEGLDAIDGSPVLDIKMKWHAKT